MLPLKDNIPSRRFPVLTVSIIAICVAVYFLFEQSFWSLSSIGEERVTELGATPCDLTSLGEGRGNCPAGDEPWWLTVLTSMFLHGSLLHLAGNMLFLWIFGNNIEDSMGRGRFVAFYLLGGVAALAGQVAIDPDATAPTVGASGAIAAVLGGYAVLYPRARVVSVIFIIIFFTIVELPALLVLGLWILMQILFGLGDLGEPVGGESGVAYFAHIGGFLFGALTIKLWANRVHEDYELAGRVPVY